MKTTVYRHNGRRAEVQELRERGHTGVEIAKILGVRPSLVYNHVHGIKIRKRTYNGAENRAKVQEQWDKGLGSRAIAQVTGLPRSTVQHHINMIKKENKECQQNPIPKEIRY